MNDEKPISTREVYDKVIRDLDVAMDSDAKRECVRVEIHNPFVVGLWLFAGWIIANSCHDIIVLLLKEIGGGWKW